MKQFKITTNKRALTLSAASVWDAMKIFEGYNTNEHVQKIEKIK